MTTSAAFAPSVHRERLARAASAAAQRGLDALLITPSPDYAYLLGYHAPELERLTCLIVRADGVPALIVPRLEAPLARHELGDLVESVELVAWDETDDPIALARSLLPGVVRVGVQDRMWAAFVLRLRAAMDPTELVEAGPAMSALRRTKSAEELDRLRAAAGAADAAMLEVLAEPLEGRTEAEVSRRVRDGL